MSFTIQVYELRDLQPSFSNHKSMKKSTYFLLAYLMLSTIANAQVPELWGSMSIGGSFGVGGIFKINGDGTGYSLQYACSGSTNGGSIQSNFIPFSQTLFYGTSVSGGTHARGEIYSYQTQTHTFTSLFSMDTLPGYYPRGPICVTSSGKIYGMTNNGGINDKGVMFEYNIASNQYTKVHEFNVSDGQLPNGGVIQSTINNKIYGMTTSGGANNLGVICSYNPQNGVFAVEHDFTFSDGCSSFGTLIQDNSGMMYGMTFGGGTGGYGVIFSFNPTNNNYTVIHNFTGSDGAAPLGQLRLYNGMLYGVTSQGGTSNKGVIFSCQLSNNNYTKLYDFNGTNGSSPFGSVILANDGKLYGMTLNGGINSLGVIYSLEPSTLTFTKIYDGAFATGGFPYADLIQYSTATAIEENTISEFKIYPNPSNGTFKIQHNENVGEGEIIIINSLGQTIATYKIGEMGNEIKLDAAPGIYYYKTKVSNKIAGKIVVQ